MSQARKLLSPIGLAWTTQTRTYKLLRDPAWTFSRVGQESRKRLLQLRASQRGRGGFIVGTGPSLRDVDFDLVRQHPSIGLNRLFLGFDEFGFVPDMLVCVNLLMMEQSARQLNALPCQLIAAWAGRKLLDGNSNTTFVRTRAGVGFSRHVIDGVYVGGTVTHVALQLAHWLGWSSVTLLGIDHNYDLNISERLAGPHQIAQRIGHDTNHFSSAYMESGSNWQLPDLEQSEDAYRRARDEWERDGRKIYDGTINGRLDVFTRSTIDYSRHRPALGH